jgi:hypothetical protein
MSKGYHETVFDVFAEIRDEVKTIQRRVDSIVRSASESGKDWGYIGDLNHILARLKELNHVDGSE